MNNDDIELHNYQDNLDTDADSVDPIMDEETDDPTEERGIPPEEFRDELDKYDVGDLGEGDGYMREAIDDTDENISGTQ